MSYKTIYSLCILFCLCACSDDRFSNPDPVVSPPAGEIISGKNLSLVIPPLSPVLPSEKSGSTKADGSGSVLRASFSGMDVELSGSYAADTRALQTIDDDSKIHSVYILQFNNTTTNAVCDKATYISGVGGGNPDLNNFAFESTVSPISRIVVIANLNEGYLNMVDWNGGTKTYGDLLNLCLTRSSNPAAYPLFPAGGGNRALMVGTSDVNIQPGKLVTVVLQRIFAKADFVIDIIPALQSKYPIWTAQLMNLPGKCYFLSAGRGATFPTSQILSPEGYYNNEAVAAVSGSFDNGAALASYIPINIYPDVQTATQQTRTLSAPRGSTYLQIVGVEMKNGNIASQVIYQIFLGNNFTTNYTISPNCHYTYKIHIKGESLDDSSVVKFVSGYWGGELKAFDQNGNKVLISNLFATKWKYEKRMEIYSTDVSLLGLPGTFQMEWGPIGTSWGAISPMDGKGNTTKIMSVGGDTYSAFKACIKMNDSQTVMKEEDWYLPSIGQLIATYLVSANLSSTMSYGYWSSTAVDDNQAYYITKTGHVLKQAKDNAKILFVRAARDLTDK